MPEFDFDSLNTPTEEKKPLKASEVIDKAMKELIEKENKQTLKASEIKEKIKKNQDTKTIETFETGKIISNKQPDIIDIMGVPEKQKVQPKITKPDIKKEYPITIVNLKEEMEERKQDILAKIDLLEFTVKNVLNKKDYWEGSIKKSGALKLAATFGISVEIISIEIENEYDKEGNLIDVHAHAKAKAIRKDKTYIEATATQSKSRYWSEKKQTFGRYSLHNLRSTAATKAQDRAILNAVGFGMTSASEMGYIDKSDNDTVDVIDSFGGNK